MKNSKAIAVILCWAAAAGCTPTVYRHWADSQVGDILADRQKRTLGYEPQVEAKTTVSDEPSKAAYSKIPTTPIPPPAISPLEPAVVKVPFGELGPDPAPAEKAPPTTPNPYDRTPIESRGADPLTLGPPTPGELRMQLDLFRSIEYAVEHSRDYQSEMENVYLQTLDVTLQRHLFEPRPFAEQQFNFTGGQRDVNYVSAMHAVTSVGVNQQLPLGGNVTAKMLTDEVSAINGNVTDGQSAGVALTASIPLLRGAGFVNLEPLINSERQLVYEIRAFETYRRSFAVDISTRYFNLMTQWQQLANARVNYNNTTLTTNQTQALYQAGRINFLEVQRAAQFQLTAESNVINAEDTYQTALDQFKISLGMPIDTDLELVPVELELHEPQAEATQSIELATQYRLDLQTARDEIEDSRRRVANAKNGLLPDVNLNGGYNLGARPEDPLLDFESRSQTYNAGITIDLPVDKLSERNVYRASLIALQRQQRAYEQLHDSIAVAARDALRQIASSRTTLEIQRIGIELAQKRLDYANELLKSSVQGLSMSSRDVVEAQTDLLSAQNSYASARAELQISILNYLRETGTLRVDPTGGALGHAMDRAAAKRANNLPN